MKRTAWVGTAVLLAILCTAQTMLAQAGVVPSNRVTFGSECGIRDTSKQTALHFVRSTGGKWTLAGAGKHSGSGDDIAARVWHQGNWMVDLHDAPASSPVMHTGQMCFDGQGRITLMIDRYMEMAQCRCLRFTSLAFAADGKVTKREQSFMSVMTNAPMDMPDAAKGFPDVWEFRKVEQLPFYSLLKK